MITTPPLLELQDLCKRYGATSESGLVDVLKEVNLILNEGESLAILGPSGSGKSTLLNLIGTLDRPSSGRVLLDGKNLRHLTNHEVALVRNQRIGFVFQLHHLLPQCTVLENVLLPTLATPQQQSQTVLVQRAEQLLDRAGIAGRRNHRPGQLSGGERQRVAVVRALINQPRLLLADEPTGSLDHASAQKLSDLLVGLNRDEGLTLIVVTHSAELAGRMKRICKMQDGKLLQEP